MTYFYNQDNCRVAGVVGRMRSVGLAMLAIEIIVGGFKVMWVVRMTEMVSAYLKMINS